MSIFTNGEMVGYLRIFALIMCGVLCSVSSVFAAPQLVVDSSVHDWGKIYSGVKKEVTFVLHNSGDEPLIIGNVRSSCGCTAAMLSSKILPPDGQAELIVRFNSQHFSGHVTKRVLLLTNDPQQRQQQFTVQAQVISELVASPAMLNLGAIEPGKALVGELTLDNHSDVPVQLKAVRSTSPHMRLNLVPEFLAPGATQVVNLTVTAPVSGTAVLNGYILIEALGHTRNQLRLPVVAKIAPTAQR
jgi:hypothetical protein